MEDQRCGHLYPLVLSLAHGPLKHVWFLIGISRRGHRLSPTDRPVSRSIQEIARNW